MSVGALIVSIASLALGVFNYRHAKYAPVREDQIALRNELKAELHPFDYWRIEKILNQLQSRMPSPDIESELRKLREFVALRRDGFIAPTPQQLETLIDTIEVTRAAYDSTRQPPKTDAVFEAGHEAAQREMLTAHFTDLRSQIAASSAVLVRSRRSP